MKQTSNMQKSKINLAYVSWMLKKTIWKKLWSADNIIIIKHNEGRKKEDLVKIQTPKFGQKISLKMSKKFYCREKGEGKEGREVWFDEHLNKSIITGWQLELFCQFRSISLCNIFVKVISKVITNMLKSIIPKLVGEEQSRFIPGR